MSIWSSFGRRWAALPSATAAGQLLKSYFDTLYAGVGSAVTTSRAINTQHSLTGGGNLSADRTLNLVNDTASPGNNKVYGTNGSGTRGWQDAPTPDYGAGNAALAYGGIGAYVWGQITSNTGIVPNSTYAGSTIVPAGFDAATAAGAGSAGQAPLASRNTTSAALSGTWRAMGGSEGGISSGGTNGQFTLFLRIS